MNMNILENIYEIFFEFKFEMKSFKQKKKQHLLVIKKGLVFALFEEKPVSSTELFFKTENGFCNNEDVEHKIS